MSSCNALCIFVIGDRKTSNLMYRLNVHVIVYGRQIVPDRGVVRSCDPFKKFRGLQSYHWNGWTKVVKFCTQVGYINSSNRMTYHQQKGRGYDHVTVLQICRLSWCSASRGFVSDSCKATCQNHNVSVFNQSINFIDERVKNHWHRQKLNTNYDTIKQIQ